MRTRLLLLALLTLAGCATADTRPEAPTAEADRPPNIVFVLADDLGWTDVGCFGSTYYETPAIDRLCAEGMRFTAAYSNGPNCAPTRASLMSGQYPPRHGIYTVNTGARGHARFRKLAPPENETVLAPSVPTLAERLQAAGYVTASMGKWHLGDAPEAGPRQQGFDVNVGGDHHGHPPTYFSPYRNAYLKDGPEGEYLTDRLTDEAVAFIEAHQDRPFFLYLPHFAVHTPIQGKEALVAAYGRKPASGGHDHPEYAAMIHSMDEGVSRVLAALDRLGLAEHTLVVFTSDNGGLGGYAEAGAAGGKEITSNAPLKGGKGMLYEGGIRVPLVVRWPGRVAPGTVNDTPVVTLDFYPTLLEAGGATAAPAHPLDGESLVPLLTGRGEELEREALYWHFPGYLEADRGRGTWRTTPAGAVRVGRYKLIEFFEDDHVELYDLAADVGETRDLSATMPDQADALRRRLHAWRDAVDAQMPRPQ